MLLAVHVEHHNGSAVRVQAIQRNEKEQLGSIDLTVRPEGGSVPLGLTRSDVEAKRFGITLRGAVRPLFELADVARTVAAHGLDEQQAIIEGAFSKEGLTWPRPGMRRICTQEVLAPLFDGKILTLGEACAEFEIAGAGAHAVRDLYDVLNVRGLLEGY